VVTGVVVVPEVVSVEAVIAGGATNNQSQNFTELQ